MHQHDDSLLSLQRWGLTPATRMEFMAFAVEREQEAEPGGPTSRLARVVSEHRAGYDLTFGDATARARVAGALRHHASDRRELPAVGDWVVADPTGELIVHVLARTSVFVRQSAGRRTEPQVVAANVDTVFIVTSADEDFSPRRIERYRGATATGGAEPVVVLNKADLVDEAALGELLGELPRDLSVVTLSALHGDGFEGLEPWLGHGRTIALVGSSGVGKSTLVNHLVGDQRQLTLPVRERDSTGRHATTRRELVLLPCGAVLVDTPGMRELQLWADTDGATGEPQDPIERIAAACAFADCGHQGEPGCAVEAAVASGELTMAQVQAYHQLRRELAYQRRRQDEGAARTERHRWKAIKKEYRAWVKKGSSKR